MKKYLPFACSLWQDVCSPPRRVGRILLQLLVISFVTAGLSEAMSGPMKPTTEKGAVSRSQLSGHSFPTRLHLSARRGKTLKSEGRTGTLNRADLLLEKQADPVAGLTLDTPCTPVSYTLCGTKTSFTLSTGNSIYTNVQWYKDGIVIPGATTMDYVATVAGMYSYSAIDATTTCSTSLCCPISITTCSPCVPESYTLCGTKTSFTLSTGTGYTNVQWFKDGVAIPGATATDYVAAVAGLYNYSAIDATGCSGTLCCPVSITTCLLACLGDYVWLDTNQNGQQDAGETGVASVTVVLYDATTNLPLSTTVTDATGRYRFCNLNPGQYYVRFTPPAGTTFTTPNTGPDGTDSDPGPGGQTPVYSLTAGQDEPTVDAGLVPLKACLGDYVWMDSNQNGQQDAGETGVASVTVVLYDATTNQPLSTTVTDGTGRYRFCNLNPGQYYVRFTPPAGTTFTTPNTGPDGTDSDPGPGGQTPVYSLTAGQDEPTVDAGLVPLPCTNSNLAAAVVLAPNVIRTQGDVVQVTYVLTNPGGIPLSGISFVGASSLFNRGNGSSTPIALVRQGDVGNDGIMQPGESWLYTGSFSSTYTPGTVFLITGSATATCGSSTINAATADLIYTVGVNMDVVIKDNCFRPGSTIGVDLITRLLIDEDAAINPGAVMVGGISVKLPKRRFEGRAVRITVNGLNNNQPFDPFNLPGGLTLTRFTDQGGVDGGRNTANVLDEQEPVNTARKPCTALGQDDVGCEFPDWAFHVDIPVPATYTGSSFSVTASDSFQLFQSIETPAGSGVYGSFEDITPATGAGGADTDSATLCQEACLGNYVWEDTNQNGQQDAGESGVSSVTVVLYNATTNTAISQMVTDASGHYQFCSLPAGNYYLVFKAPANRQFTQPNVGSDGTDSDVDSSGRTPVYTLTAGQSNLTVGAGLTCKAPACVPVVLQKRKLTQ